MNRKIRTMLVAWLAAMLILSVLGIAISSDVSFATQDDGEESQPFDPPVDDGEARENRAEDAAANGSATFIKVEGYDPWAALVINAGDPAGVDAVTVDFENNTLIIEATDSNETNHVSILINKAFADEHLAEAEDDLEINTSDAVNYDGLDESNASAGGGAMYVFQIDHFSTQTIEMSSQPFDPPVDDGEARENRAEDAAANGSATFLKVEGYDPWAALVINAGDPAGVDAVTVDFENNTLIIEATDSNETNHVSILINKAFADEYLAVAEDDLEINTSDAVNYDGLDESNASAGGGAMYVFQIDHFSTQTIEMSSQPFDPPVDDGEARENRAEDAGANGSATFLKVEGYEPWAALVINAGDPAGVDAVTVSFENDTLRIEATDSNETNHVTILINKAFADEHLADSEGDLNIETSDAVNSEGLDESNASAGGGAMYVFQIEHFSTQTIEMSSQPFDPPVEDGETHRNRTENAAAHGAATFLQVDDYQPWAALVINAGDPAGVDAVTVSFENDTLKIEATDSNETNHVSILINKAFADDYLADSEGDLDIETSDAVNYDGLDNSNASAGGGAMYVFQIEHFSTQTIEMSAEDTEDTDSIPFLGTPMLLIAIAIPVAYYTLKKKKQ